MIVKIRRTSEVPSSEITSEPDYVDRRKFLGAGAVGAAFLFSAAGAAHPPEIAAPPSPGRAAGLVGNADGPGRDARLARRRPRQDLEPTPERLATRYNNFYEFGTGKEDPARNAHSLRTSPWTVKVDGLCSKPAEYQLEDFVKPSAVEDRIYRFRCVEAWSMVVPWRGFPLADVIKRAEPAGDAKYVAFETLWDPEQMPERRWRPRIGWPYREGLRMDEAMHPLAFLATGMYGKTLPNQNGAPIRLVVPWKYGFKSIKSIVRITFTATEPPTTWATQTPGEYGFYSNVNPDVSHPRWSQARERPLGKFRRVPTRFLNGYADEVGHLYEDMDLKKFF